MSADKWTLEGELQKIADAASLNEALVALRLKSEREEEEPELRVARDWYRAGDETYALQFSVTSSTESRVYLMKACVAYDGTHGLDDTFASWLERRSILSGLGIVVPILYGARAATLIEEFVPMELAAAIRKDVRHPPLLEAVGTTAALLVNGGFAPLTTIDWRSHGHDVVIVDFGQDLGPPRIASPGHESGILSEVLDNLAHSGLHLSPDALMRIVTAYERTLR